jgi:hypothetical protein
MGNFTQGNALQVSSPLLRGPIAFVRCNSAYPRRSQPHGRSGPLSKFAPALHC